MTDSDRLDFLAHPDYGVSFRYLRQSGGAALDEESLAFQRWMRVQVFSVPSQHVYGTDLRDALDRAIRITESRLSAWPIADGRRS